MRLARRALTSLATCLALGAISTGVALGGEPISIGADTGTDVTAEVDVDLATDADVLVQTDADVLVETDADALVETDADATLDVDASIGIDLGSNDAAVVDPNAGDSTLDAQAHVDLGNDEAVVVDLGTADVTVQIADDDAGGSFDVATGSDPIVDADLMVDADVATDLAGDGDDTDGATVLVHAPVLIDATMDELVDIDAAAEVCIGVGIVANAPACDAWTANGGNAGSGSNGSDGDGITALVDGDGSLDATVDDVVDADVLADVCIGAGVFADAPGCGSTISDGSGTLDGDGITALVDADGSLDATVDDLAEADVLADVCVGVGVFADAPGCGTGGTDDGGTTPDADGITALIDGDGSLDATVDDVVDADLLADVCVGVGIFDHAPECHGVLSGGGNVPDEGTSPGSGNAGDDDGTSPGRGNVGDDGNGPGFAAGPGARTTGAGHAIPAERAGPRAGSIPDTATGVTNQLVLWGLVLLLVAAASASRGRRRDCVRS